MFNLSPEVVLAEDFVGGIQYYNHNQCQKLGILLPKIFHCKEPDNHQPDKHHSKMYNLASQPSKDIKNCACSQIVDLRNEFNFWSFQRITNTLGLLQSK